MIIHKHISYTEGSLQQQTVPATVEISKRRQSLIIQIIERALVVLWQFLSHNNIRIISGSEISCSSDEKGVCHLKMIWGLYNLVVISEQYGYFVASGITHSRCLQSISFRAFRALHLKSAATQVTVCMHNLTTTKQTCSNKLAHWCSIRAHAC